MLISTVKRSFCAVLVSVVFAASIPVPASARVIGTEESLAVSGDERARVDAWMARAGIREQMLVLGVDPAQVQARVAALGDDEVRDLAGRLDSLPAGGMSIIGTLFAVFVILLVTDILGLTKVFSFTRSVR